MLLKFPVPGVFTPLAFPLFIIACFITGSASFSLLAQGHPDKYEGRVVAVYDGDTLTLLTADKQQIKVRLAEIDAPEARQPYGSRAKQVLSDLVFNKTVSVEVQDIDRYSRVVGRVYLPTNTQEAERRVDVNAELVRAGAVWVYRQYAKDQKLFALEQQARETKAGLWGLPEVERNPPWDWRRIQSAASKKPTTAKQSEQLTADDFRCGQKTMCSQMLSCEEALFYLRQCTIDTLDGDKDGRPCEALCQ